MNPLEALMRPLAALLNRKIAETTPARELCRRLDGTSVVVRVRDTSLALRFRVHVDAIELAPGATDDPDIVVTGSLLSLARLATDGGEEAFRSGAVDIEGDAESAEAFRQLLAFARPDPEEELSQLVGDPVAHAAGDFVRRLRRWSRDARSTMAANVREYLQEESRDVPSRYETEHFADEVGRLRDDVERLAARIERLGDRH